MSVENKKPFCEEDECSEYCMDTNIAGSDDESAFEDQGVDIGELLSDLFTDSKKNRNICDVLMEIKRQIEVHNKILLSISQKITPV